MYLIATKIFTIILIVNIISSEADEHKSDELTLRNQLFADVFLLKEGVDRLQISVEVLNKRFNNQMEILKGLHSQLSTDSPESEVENNVCDRIAGMFNTTLRKHNIVESKIITKLEELQEEQTMRFDEIIVKQNLNKNCNPPGATTTTLSLLATTLQEVSEKIDNFEKKLNSQQTELEKFVSTQTTILQTINDKMAKNQEQLEKMHKELTNIRELKIDSNKVTYPRPKLPMEVILGLTSSNITTLK